MNHGKSTEEDDGGDDYELPLSLSVSQVEELAAKHSGDYIRKQNPRLYESIKVLLEWGVPHSTIAKRVKVGRNVVIAIARESEQPSLEHHKRVMIEGLRRLSRGATERLIEWVESGRDIPAQALAVILGIAVEKTELLSGGATQRREIVADPELLAFQQALLAGSGQAMVSPGEKLAANGGRLPDPARIVDVELTGDDKTLDNPQQP